MLSSPLKLVMVIIPNLFWHLCITYHRFLTLCTKSVKFIHKVEKILKGSLDLIPSPSSSVKVQIVDRKVFLRWRAKHCWALSKNLWKQKVCWCLPAMFCLVISSKLFRRSFEFSLKVKVMGSNPGYIFLNLFYFKIGFQSKFWMRQYGTICSNTSERPEQFLNHMLLKRIPGCFQI